MNLKLLFICVFFVLILYFFHIFPNFYPLITHFLDVANKSKFKKLLKLYNLRLIYLFVYFWHYFYIFSSYFHMFY